MERMRLGLGALGAALLLGLLGDVLLRAIPWGINGPLWVAALILCVVLLIRLGGLGPGDGECWLTLLALLFAGFIAWRAAPMLVFLNVSTLLATLSLAAVRARQGSLKLSGIFEYVLGGLYTGLCAAAGPVPVVLKDVEWREVAHGRWRSMLAATRGVLIAAPLLLVFGSLFVAADVVFERLVRDVFDFDVNRIFTHLLLAGFVAWVSAGFLRLVLLGREPGWTSLERPANLSLGAVEISIALGLLNVLFLMFVVVQVRYLFGGLGEISTSDLTYAKYARRGFFELAAVTTLVLPLLLLAHWLFRPQNRTREKVFKVLSGSLLVLLSIIMASALCRMWLYLQEFGLTELRFYATAFMVWLAVVLSWFAVTVLLRDRRNRFAYGALLSGFAAMILLNAVNPDSIIARVNLNRMEDGKRFDPYYLTTLSADAAPALVASLPEIGEDPLYEDVTVTPSGKERFVKGPTMRQAIVDRYKLETSDWRTWNFSRRRAGRLAQSIATSPLSRSTTKPKEASQPIYLVHLTGE
ncbi:hypothetical protein BH24ACT22_BH24ACT22_14170 [soil metagenome]